MSLTNAAFTRVQEDGKPDVILVNESRIVNLGEPNVGNIDGIKPDVT